MRLLGEGFAMKAKLKSLWNDVGGATLVEYGLIALIVAIAGVAAVDVLGQAVANIIDIINTNFS